MTSTPLKTEILNNLEKNKVIFYGELASELVKRYASKNSIIIDAREIEDCKALTGTHTFETTGVSFRNGLLAQAMMNGTTFIILNIDKNIRLYNYLQSVIETNEIHIDGITHAANKEFRIFYTSFEHVENKNMLSVGPLSLNFAGVLDLLSESVNIKRDLRNSMVHVMEHICGIYNDTSIDITTFYKLDRLVSPGFTTLEAFFEKFTTLFIMGFDDKARNEAITYMRELLCLSKQEVKIEERYMFDNFIVNHKNIQTIKSITSHIASNIPVVITGETGVGKTTLIQKISERSFRLFGYHTNLIVYNMSYDVDLQELVGLYESYPSHKVKEYRKKYNMEKGTDIDFLQKICTVAQDSNEKVAKKDLKELRYLLANANKQFVFKENVLLRAIKNGDWVLFDEINLAPNDLLDGLNAILEHKRLYVLERGDLVPVTFHKNFRVFACMNPGTDYGKKDFRSTVFSEIYYDDFSCDYTQLLQIALEAIVKKENIKNEILQKNAALVVENKDIANALEGLKNLAKAVSLFFIDVKTAMLKQTIKGNEIEPVITGRTFTRLLSNIKCADLHNLIEILFYTQFCTDSYAIVKNITSKYFSGSIIRKAHKIGHLDYDFFITKRNQKYIDMIENCIRLSLPVLLQGPTSTGKTSSLYHLSKKHNVKLHRINNHENTDVGDYLGNYKCDKEGNIYFEKGILIQAMLSGDWLLLDELNLAQSEVLEVLNRLLDDNNEIMCNNEIIRPHRRFRLFATQNLNYSGRKRLSRAFRNRFVEIFYDKFGIEDIKELLSCKGLPTSYTSVITETYDKLYSLRSYNSYITLRDIFKWISGNIESKEKLFYAGLNFVYEKERNIDAKEKILVIFEKTFRLSRDLYFKEMQSLVYIKKHCIDISEAMNYIIIDDFVFTKSYIRLFNLLYENYNARNAVLIVGETGIGKTKCIELLARVCKKKLYTVGMHENIDSSDFVGNYTIPISWNDGPLLKAMRSGDFLLIDEINLGQSSVLEQLNSVFESKRSIYISEINQTVESTDGFSIFACMNPATDFGKKELSPALRNRFTELFFEITDEEKYMIFEILLRKNVTDTKFCHEFLSLLQKHKHFVAKLSLRKTTDIISSIKSFYKKQQIVHVKNVDITAEFVFKELFCKRSFDRPGWDYFDENNISYIGVWPYFIIRTANECKLPILSKTTKYNMGMLLKALLSNKPILLKGSPGVGKTSFIVQLAKYMNHGCVRINLSDETEFFELCGSYMPIVNNNEMTIDYVNSELVNGIQNDSWIILDEINLASQTIIEGLNSLLDHRKELYLNKTIKMSNNTRIFATMNDFSALDGRKTLPKSFLDRFVILDMKQYDGEDIAYIIGSSIKKYDFCNTPISNKTFILYKEINKTKIYINAQTVSSEALENMCLEKINAGFSLRSMLAYLKILIDDRDKVHYDYDTNLFNIQSKHVMLESLCILDNSFTITHKNINQLMQILLCAANNIPVIITGKIGKTSIASFASRVLNKQKYTFYCHNEVDCNDLLGQFTYSNNTFRWQSSLLIENCTKNDCLIVFDKPEHVQKSVFDRLNALFEGQKSISIHEKGFDTNTTIGDNISIVLLCNDTTGLSNAILDRCWKVNLSDEFDIIDVNKVCNTARTNKQSHTKKVKDNDYKINQGYNLEEISMLKNTYDTDMITNFQNISYHYLPFIRNFINEREIKNILNFSANYFEFTDDELEIKNRHDYRQLLQFYKKINYNIKTHDGDFEKLRALRKYKTAEKQIICFFKNSNLSILSEKPRNLEELKYGVFQFIVNASVKDYKKCKKYAKYCQKLHFNNLKTDLDNYYSTFLLAILGLEGNRPFDPLLLIKIEKLQRYNAKIKIAKDRIHTEFVKLYKYGKSKIESAIEKFVKIHEQTVLKLNKITNTLHRNFVNYATDLKNTDISSSINQLLATNLFPDICDYALLNQYSTESLIKPLTLRSLYLAQSTIPLSERAVIYNILKKYKIEINNAFSKNFFVETNTFCEMLTIRDKNYEIEPIDTVLFQDYCNTASDYFDLVFEELFTSDDRYQINFYDEMQIKITDLLYATIKSLKIKNIKLHKKIMNLPIFSRPEYILEHYKAPELLKYYQSCTKKLEWTYNYSWLLMLHLIDFTQERITEYLLDTKIYQYFERQYFIREFLSKEPNKEGCGLLYNISLQYVAFEIDKKFDNYKETNSNKIWYDNTVFTGYKKILQEDTLSHVTAITVNEKDFTCQCEHYNFESKDPYINNIMQFLGKDRRESCVYELEEIEELHKFCYQSFDISRLFYTRKITNKYSDTEIQLAKIFNEYIQIADSLVTKQKVIIEGLLYIAIAEETCINILLLLHHIIDKNKKYETENSGDGMKEGTGDKNISEDIKQEEEICDDVKFEEIENIEESDGVENSNDGCIDDVSDDSELSSQETAGCEEEEADDESNCEGSTEEINDCDSDFSNADEKTVSSDNLNCDQEESDSKNNEEDNNCEINTYQPLSGSLNDEQTCDNAENYSNLVKGERKEIEGAQEDEEGDHYAENRDHALNNCNEENVMTIATMKEDIKMKVVEHSCTRLVNLLKHVFCGNRRNKYNGDYRSGKKLNMKKIVPFILSDYRKDKIWLKRNRMEKREYVVRIFVDNSQSMNQEQTVNRLSIIFTNLTKAFEILEIPIEIYSFGASLVSYKNREDFFSTVKFDHRNTNIGWIDNFTDGINIILTDGIFQVQCQNNHNFILLLINNSKINSMKKIIVTEDGIVTKRYIDSIKLRYCIVEEIENLEEEFVSAIKELVNNND